EAFFHMLQHQIVDLRADPPDDLAAALGQPQLRARMLEPRVLARGDEPVHFVLQRRDPGGVVLVDLPREVDEGLLVFLGDDRTDGDGVAAHGGWLAVRPSFVIPAKTGNQYFVSLGSRLRGNEEKLFSPTPATNPGQIPSDL